MQFIYSIECMTQIHYFAMVKNEETSDKLQYSIKTG